MSRKRVLLVNHTTVMGGAEVGFAEWVRVLDRELLDPLVVLPDDGPLYERLLHDGQPVALQPVSRLTRSRNPLRLIMMAARVYRQAKGLHRLALGHDAHVLHANSHSAYLVSVLAARRAGRPCIWHVRDLVPLGWMGRWMYRQAGAIVAISPAVARFVQQYRCGRDRVHLIPNGIDTHRYATAGACRDLRETWFPGLPDDVLLIGMVGNLAPWKRHDLFLDLAVRLLRPAPERFRFVLVGDDRFGDHPDYVRILRQRVDSTPLSDRVRMAGYCDAMPAVMQALDILVHPASREPFGRVLVEAMAAAKPVVAVNNGGPADIVIDGQTGWLTPPDDVQAMLEAVEALAQDDGLRTRMGGEGRQRAVAAFDVRRVGRSLTALYALLAKGGL